MDSNSHSKKTAMGNLFSNVVGKMLHVQPAVIDKRELNLAQKKANIRAVSVRKGFQSILARGDEMAQRLNHYRRQHEAMIAKRDGVEIAELAQDEASDTIVMSSS
jgi:hypothetical protein